MDGAYEDYEEVRISKMDGVHEDVNEPQQGSTERTSSSVSEETGLFQSVTSVPNSSFSSEKSSRENEEPSSKQKIDDNIPSPESIRSASSSSTSSKNKSRENEGSSSKRKVFDTVPLSESVTSVPSSFASSKKNLRGKEGLSSKLEIVDKVSLPGSVTSAPSSFYFSLPGSVTSAPSPFDASEKKSIGNERSAPKLKIIDKVPLPGSVTSAPSSFLLSKIKSRENEASASKLKIVDKVPLPGSVTSVASAASSFFSSKKNSRGNEGSASKLKIDTVPLTNSDAENQQNNEKQIVGDITSATTYAKEMETVPLINIDNLKHPDGQESVASGDEIVGDLCPPSSKKKGDKTKCSLLNGIPKGILCSIIFAAVVLAATGALMPSIIEIVAKEEIVTALPSQIPTVGPTVSPVPTRQPSFKPSMRPSSTPTESLVPSEGPSATPSAIPSSLPSLSPTSFPTLSPSSSPTHEPINPNWSFKLKLFWKKGYYWQEERFERFYCAECVRCDEIGRGDGWEHGCNSYGDENSCRVGDAIWIRENCRSRGIEFNVLQRSNKARAPRAYLLRIDNRNLCMARTEGTKMKIRKCDMDDKTQLWAPWGDFSKFELRPYEQIGWSERRADCVSNLHHPKDKEVLSLHNCRLSRIYETRYWEDY